MRDYAYLQDGIVVATYQSETPVDVEDVNVVKLNQPNHFYLDDITSIIGKMFLIRDGVDSFVEPRTYRYGILDKNNIVVKIEETILLSDISGPIIFEECVDIGWEWKGSHYLPSKV
jgi:hypothetical protein